MRWLRPLIFSCLDLERHRATREGSVSEPNDLLFCPDHADFVIDNVVMIRLRVQRWEIPHVACALA